jgi:hypothetical protein
VTEELIDISTAWTGTIAGSVPFGTVERLKLRYKDNPWVLNFLSDVTSDDPGAEHLRKQLWKISMEAVHKILFVDVQQGVSEVLGKAPQGSWEISRRASKVAYAAKYPEYAAQHPELRPSPTPGPSPTNTP